MCAILSGFNYLAGLDNVFIMEDFINKGDFVITTQRALRLGFLLGRYRGCVLSPGYSQGYYLFDPLDI